MTKIVMCVSTWPEADQQDFEVFAVRPGETDEQAISRAEIAYSKEDEFYIVGESE